MHKRILFFFSVVIFTTAHAQLHQNAVVLGADLGLTHTNRKAMGGYTYGSGLRLGPAVGLAINEHGLAGLTLLYVHSKNSDPLIGSEEFRYGGGVFYRRYTTLGRRLYLFGQGALQYRLYKSESRAGLQNTFYERFHQVELSVHPGLAYAVASWLHLEINLNNLLALHFESGTKTHVEQTVQTVVKEHTVALDSELNAATNIGVGFRILLSH